VHRFKQRFAGLARQTRRHRRAEPYELNMTNALGALLGGPLSFYGPFR
jgi:hypothetical protein